jgi:glycosyltransferase involved in cell wall biosynthesis
MKVLHVINGESYAGAERVQDLLALRLPDHGFEVSFACIKPGVFAERRAARTAALETTPMRGRFDLTPAVAIARRIRRERMTLVHTHTPRSALIGRVASLLAGVPMVHHVHSPTSRDTENRVKNFLNVATERAALARVSRLIPVSASLQDQLVERGISRERIRLVPNGVPTPGPLPQRLLPGPTWTLGCVALFRPRKGLEVLIDAMASLRAPGTNVRLRAVGAFENEDYRKLIEQRVREHELGHAITWVGFTSDVNGELAQMDALVLPSLFGEGMPMVVLEAMAAGVPVVATRVEGTPEVIEHGHSGLLVPPGDAGALAATLRQLIDGQVDWLSLRRMAYERQAAQFSDHAMGAGVAAVYRELLVQG